MVLSFHTRGQISLNNGSNQVHAHQNRQKLFHQLNRLWPQFSRDALMMDYLQKRQTYIDNGTYNSSLLRQLKGYIDLKCRRKLKKKGKLFLFTSLIAMAAIHDNGLELIEHLPYLPHLAPSDFHFKLRN